MSHNLFGRSIAVAAILATSAFLYMSPAPVSAEEGARVYPLAGERVDDRLPVEVMVEGAEDLAGYQLVLSWDAELLALSSGEETEFLAATGRQPFCPEPVESDDAIRLVCVTLAPPPEGIDPDAYVPPAGVSGSGALAQLEFDVLGDGKLSLKLSSVKLVNPDGEDIPSSVEDQQLRLGASDGLPGWAWMSGAGAGIVVLLFASTVGARVWQSRRRGA